MLDAVDMEPPEPLVRAQELAHDLGAGDYLRLQHRREPFLLYDNLKQQGFSYITCTGSEVAYVVFIWREADVEAQSAVEAQILNQTDKFVMKCSSMKNTNT